MKNLSLISLIVVILLALIFLLHLVRKGPGSETDPFILTDFYLLYFIRLIES